MKDPQNHGLDVKLFNYIVESNRDAPYYKTLGIKTRALSPGLSEMVVEADSRHTNPLGLIHGGMIASLADAAMGNAVRTLGCLGVTVDCSVSFLAAAPTQVELVGKGRVIKAGRSMVFVEAMVYAGEMLVAQAKGTFFNSGSVDIDSLPG